MKRLRRWLFNFTAAVSGLLCIAVGILWAASYSRTFQSEIQISKHHEIWSQNGWLGLYALSSRVFVLPTTIRAGMVPSRMIRVPHGVLMVVLAVAPAIVLLGHKQRRREAIRKQGNLCVRCGYDLRATPEDCSRYPLNYACPGCSGRGH